MNLKKENNFINCRICLEDIVNTKDIEFLPCAHGFHKECIDDLIHNNSFSPICPLCKIPIFLNTSEQLDSYNEFKNIRDQEIDRERRFFQRVSAGEFDNSVSTLENSNPNYNLSMLSIHGTRMNIRQFINDINNIHGSAPNLEDDAGVVPDLLDADGDVVVEPEDNDEASELADVSNEYEPNNDYSNYDDSKINQINNNLINSVNETRYIFRNVLNENMLNSLIRILNEPVAVPDLVDDNGNVVDEPVDELADNIDEPVDE